MTTRDITTFEKYGISDVKLRKCQMDWCNSVDPKTNLARLTMAIMYDTQANLVTESTYQEIYDALEKRLGFKQLCTVPEVNELMIYKEIIKCIHMDSNLVQDIKIIVKNNIINSFKGHANPSSIIDLISVVFAKVEREMK